MNWTVVGGVTAIISIILNILQLLQNQSLKNKLHAQQTVGNNSNPVQQTHSGHGHNVNAGGNVQL
ncbi:hypothetical protein GCM10023092_25830 [Rurimicrobium arvi]|uniref:Uncharacterized protein n=1 Tax=Rurimicrobium arvi TaxID=2049916 RepID=A0ABP8N1F8_9BACT